MEKETSRNSASPAPPGGSGEDTCREIRPANIYDTAANESWLEDQAAQGWHLTGMAGWRGIFQRGEPAQVRYRMQPVGKKKERPAEEVRDLYGALGWEYVCTLENLFHIWRCDDPSAPELDTDPVVQELGYGYLKRRMAWDCVLTVLLLAAFLTLWAWLPGMTDTPLLDTVRECVPGQILAVAGLCVLGLVQIACQIRSMVCLLRRLRAGIPQERPRPYRRQLWLARILLACVIFVISARLVGGFRNMHGSSLSGGWDAGDSYHDPDSGVVYVDLAQLEGAEHTEFWSCRTKFMELCPRMYAARQFAELSGGEQVFLQTAYYRMLTDGLARTLTAELTENRAGFLDSRPELPLEPIEAQGLDGFWWAEETDGTGAPEQFAVLRQGNRVLSIWYTGSADLRTRTGYFAALLSG